MSHLAKNGLAGKLPATLLVVTAVLLLSPAIGGCGQASPEQTAYKFLGAVQAHDCKAMCSCINPDALQKVEQGDGELSRQWDELYRKYLIEPINWRMEFDGITVECSYLDNSDALVRLTGGRCSFYKLVGGKWAREGEIDFSTEDFAPLYMVRKNGNWYLEALHLYIIFGLENAARV